jgi:hypothetical protein
MTTTTPSDERKQVLYKHRDRPRWGLAVLAWDHIDKRGYQFEDGKLRVFKRGYYQLLEEVDPPMDKTRRVLEQLNRALGRHEARKASPRTAEAPITLASQIEYFKELYPDGFRDAAWKEKMRGVGVKRALKRNRDPAIESARARLAGDALDRLLASDLHDEVVETLITVLDKTSLVSAAKLKLIREAPYHRRQAIALALRDLLQGDTSIKHRLESFVRSIGDPSWELATAPLALCCPEQHVCVTPSVFKLQAQWMAPRLEHPRAPDGETYTRYLEMALAVRRQLESAGLRPQDLLDVHDFVCLTLRPAARKAMARRSSATAGDESREAA